MEVEVAEENCWTFDEVEELRRRYFPRGANLEFA